MPGGWWRHRCKFAPCLQFPEISVPNFAMTALKRICELRSVDATATSTKQGQSPNWQGLFIRLCIIALWPTAWPHVAEADFYRTSKLRPKDRHLGKLISAFATGASQLAKAVRAADCPVVTGFKSGGEHNNYNHGRFGRTCYDTLNV